MAQKMLMMAVLVILGTKIATFTAANPTCLHSLMSCAPYFDNATLKLKADCCDPLKQAVATELTCLCSLINNPTLLSSFNINIPIPAALRISHGCGVADKMKGCIPATPTPAPSPSATPPKAAPPITRR